MNGFQINQVVFGVRAGKFIVVGFRSIGGEPMVTVREVNPDGSLGRGEMQMPPASLRA